MRNLFVFDLKCALVMCASPRMPVCGFVRAAVSSVGILAFQPAGFPMCVLLCGLQFPGESVLFCTYSFTYGPDWSVAQVRFRRAVRACTRARVCTCACVHACMRVSVCMRARACVCVCVCVRACVCVRCPHVAWQACLCEVSQLHGTISVFLAHRLGRSARLAEYDIALLHMVSFYCL